LHVNVLLKPITCDINGTCELWMCLERNSS
jgi:hypothetical protein